MKQPLIIIGAPRSGTNMLRDLLVKLEGVDTWPCDEINYIWRHGNRDHNSDMFTEEMATEKVAKFIRNEFEKQSKATNASTLVEKTCANSLRVDFVNKIFPDAKYIFIVRDGLDVVGSAKKRWKAKLDLPYILKKAKYVPKSDFFYYGANYLKARLYKLASKDDRLSIWGPQMDNVDKLLEKHSLEEVCALQWKRCVDESTASFENIDDERVYKVRYEEFVSSPSKHFLEICKFIESDCTEEHAQELTGFISTGSLGKGRGELSDELVETIKHMTKDTMSVHGYE